jgi:hypothetical protein
MHVHVHKFDQGQGWGKINALIRVSRDLDHLSDRYQFMGYVLTANSVVTG